MRFVLIFSFLLSSPVFAGKIMKCRDRGNFMSSWFELWIERSSSHVEGQLVFQTANGPELIQEFKTKRKRDTLYSGGNTIIDINEMTKSDFIEFSTVIDNRVFEESFKCPKYSQKDNNKIIRSAWGTQTAYRLFDLLNVPVQLNNGGFREIRKTKVFDGYFKLEVRQLGSHNYSYTLEVRDPLIKNSEAVKEAFKYLLDSEGRLELPEIGASLYCSNYCYLALY